MSKLFCPKCGTENPESTKFCAHCGFPLTGESAVNYSPKERPHRELRRSTKDKFIAGVIGGIGSYLGISSTLLRIIVVIISLSGVGIPVMILGYLIFLMFMKKDN